MNDKNITADKWYIANVTKNGIRQCRHVQAWSIDLAHEVLIADGYVVTLLVSSSTLS